MFMQLQVKSCLVFEKTAVPATKTNWVAGRLAQLEAHN